LPRARARACNHMNTVTALAEFFHAAHAEEHLRNRVLKDAARKRVQAPSVTTPECAPDFSI